MPLAAIGKFVCLTVLFHIAYIATNRQKVNGGAAMRNFTVVVGNLLATVRRSAKMRTTGYIPRAHGEVSLSAIPPEKIHLIPDDFHIRHVGHLADGRLFLVDSQLSFDGKTRATRDYVCTFIFDVDGHLIDHQIDLHGERGAYPQSKAKETFDRHLAALGAATVAAIWIRPFTVMAFGLDFGFVPRQLDDGGWCVESMPGNTLAFYPPWEEGGYDT